MLKGIVRLVYYKVIDASSQQAWDKNMFEDTYREFFMQAQTYNPDDTYQTFQELLEHVPNAAQLHYLTSRVALGYLKKLNQRMPDITNALGKRCVPFTEFKFEVLASHVQQQKAHRIAIAFYSDPITWIDTIDGRLLLAYGDQRAALQAGQVVETDLIGLQPSLSVWSFQPYITTV